MKLRKKEKIKDQNDSFSLSVYLMALRNLHPSATSYKEQAALLYEEFGIEVSDRDLYMLEEPNLEELEEEYKLIYRQL